MTAGANSIDEILARCDLLARFTETPGRIDRPFLCPAMRPTHAAVESWMRDAGMSVRVDAVGNIIGRHAGVVESAPVFVIGSHLDTVPDAGRYDGILGVLLGIAAVARLHGRKLPFAIDVIGFSEEEGVRFRASYLGSKAVCGCFEPELLARCDAGGMSLADAVVAFGLDPSQIPAAAYPPGSVIGYLETHIEQGPILEAIDQPIGVVEGIVGQSRLWLTFEGHAGHAGTQPMNLRRDALVAASEFVVAVDRHARDTEGLRATVGSLTVAPGAINVVPGSVRLSLDVRHADDDTRRLAVAELLDQARTIGVGRGAPVVVVPTEDHAAVRSDPRLTALLSSAARSVGWESPTLVSGAGHDAAIMARLAPMTMLFVRSPGGISHHPDEAVRPGDVAAALDAMVAFLNHLAGVST